MLIIFFHLESIFFHFRFLTKNLFAYAPCYMCLNFYFQMLFIHSVLFWIFLFLLFIMNSIVESWSRMEEKYSKWKNKYHEKEYSNSIWSEKKQFVFCLVYQAQADRYSEISKWNTVKDNVFRVSCKTRYFIGLIKQILSSRELWVKCIESFDKDRSDILCIKMNNLF